jgi:solute carrier family 25 S-adenosylmethionine transporter 26
MAQALIHPIDTVKTRLQVTEPAKQLRKWRRGVTSHHVDLYVGTRRVIRAQNWLIKGPQDIYLGFTGAVLGTIPTAFLYFTAYEWCKRQLQKRGHDNAMTHVVSASAGAVISAFVRVPTDTLKHRVQAYMHSNIFEAGRHILAKEGIAGLYHGLLPTLLRDVPEIAIQFALYERLRQSMESHRRVPKLQTWEHLVLGGFSGACAATATMPLDNVKTIIQCSRSQPIAQVLQQTMQDQGVSGLFAGLGPRVTQTAIMSAVFFTLFEFWKSQLKPEHFRDPQDKLLRPKVWRKRRDHVWKRQFVYN